MNPRLSVKWILGAILSVAWLPGVAGQTGNDSPQTRSAESPAPATIPLLDLQRSQPIALTNTLPKPPKIKLSPWANEIVKLATSRIGDDVIFTFIDNSGTFNLGAEQIIYLSDLGVSGEVISAMLQHDQDLVSGVRPLTIASEPDYESSLPKPIGMTSVAPVRSNPPAVSAPAPRVDLNVEQAPVVSTVAPDVNAGPPNVRFASLPQPASANFAATAPSALNPPRATAGAKKPLYPVRAGHAVELTAPIIFSGEQELPPNTFIIVGFPRTEPAAP